MLDLDNTIAPGRQVIGKTRYQAIFDNSLEAIVITDAAGVIQSTNPAVKQIFGHDPAELIGRNIGLLLPGAAAKRRNGRPGNGAPACGSDAADMVDRGAGRRRDGSGVALEIARAEWRHDGATCFANFMRELGGRDESGAALANREAHLANLYALSGAGLAETDSTGRFVSVNDRYCEIVGRDREELLGLRLHDITHPDDHQRNLLLTVRLAADAGPILLDERYVRGDGSVVWVTKTASPVRIEGDEPIALVVAIDVTERKAAEATLRASEERLRILHNELAHFARVNDLGEMAVAIAHEINQPLTAIANYLNAGRIVVNNEPTVVTLAAARKAMALAEDQALRAGKIVHGLREFARKGQGTRRIVAADSLADAAMAMTLVNLRDSGINLTHEAPCGEALVEADPVQIEQVLMNLLRNAIDALATNPPGAPRDLRIITRDLPAEGVVEFCVSDSGPGIAPAIRSRLFQTFVTTKAAGMGMGLSVCRRIVEAHGGSIAADLACGTGATFRIRLPLHRMNEEDSAYPAGLNGGWKTGGL